MTDQDEPNGEAQEPSFLMRSTTAAAVTALCTVLVALSAYLAASAASDSDDEYAIAAQSLEDANFWYEQGANVLRDDLSNLLEIDTDPYCVVGLVFGADSESDVEDQLEEIGEYCYELGEDEVAEAVEWTLDDDVLAVANENQEAADAALESGLENSAKSVDYQAALVLFAIGLALSAWAALTNTADKARVIFLLLAVIALSGGLVRLATV